MTLTSTDAALNFNPFDPVYVEDPHSFHARFRAEAPVYYWEPGNGYMFFRHRDVMALLRDPRLTRDGTLGAGIQKEIKDAYPEFAALRENDLILIGAASHARVRALANPSFSPRALELHRPKVTAIAGALLDKLPREGVFDVAREFSSYFPVRVISAILNISPGHEADFIEFAKAVATTYIMPWFSEEIFDACMPAISRGVALVRTAIEERRKRPMEGDLLSDLIHACDAEQRLSDGELISLVANLLSGGSDTTGLLTSYAILDLLRHPKQLALVRSQPSLCRGAIEEALRHDSFGRIGFPLFATETFTYEGVTLERGKPVFLNGTSAFRDPEFVSDADAFDVQRQMTSTPWFGFGPHFCIGASLARMEVEIALQMLLERYPVIELAGQPVYGMNLVFRDIVELPVRVSAGSKA